MEPSTALKHTPFHEFHRAAGGKLVDFAGFEMPVRYTGDVREHQAVRTAVGLLKNVKDSCAAEALSSHVEAFVPHLVINQVRSHEDERLGESMEWISDRFIRIPMRFAGAIPYDPTLVQCVKSRQAYLSEYPRTRTAEMLRAVAESFSSPRAGPRGGAGPRTPERDAYSALDLRPGAMQEEVLTAYLRLRRTLRSDSPALASLDCEAERQATVAAIEEAYRSLSRNLTVPSPVRRRPVRSSVPLL